MATKWQWIRTHHNYYTIRTKVTYRLNDVHSAKTPEFHTLIYFLMKIIYIFYSFMRFIYRAMTFNIQ